MAELEAAAGLEVLRAQNDLRPRVERRERDIAGLKERLAESFPSIVLRLRLLASRFLESLNAVACEQHRNEQHVRQNQ